MKSIFEKAVNGEHAAVAALYEKYRNEVTALCRACLGSTKEADEAVVRTFRETLKPLLLGSFGTEGDYRTALLKKAALLCRRGYAAKGMKSLPLPSNRSFLLSGPFDIPEGKPSAMDVLLTAQPGVNRFVFALNSIAGLDRKTISSVTGWSGKITDAALEAEIINRKRILGRLEKQDGINFSLENEVLRYKTIANLPESCDRQIRADIAEAVRPFEHKRRMRRILIWGLGIVLCAALCLAAGLLLTADSVPEENTESASEAAEAAEETAGEETAGEETAADAGETEEETEAAAAEGTVYYADIEIEGYGTVTAELDADAAPETVANFISLAESGFYDGLTFHRIIEGFMMQGGDPNGDGTGGSDTTITGEFSENGFDNPLSHTRGAISMARSNDYDSASSQFFIVQEDSTYLDGQYAVFGYVTEGMDIVDAICEKAEPTDDNGTIPAEEQPVITSVTIRTE